MINKFKKALFEGAKFDTVFILFLINVLAYCFIFVKLM